MEILYFDLAGTTWEWLEVKCLAPSLVIELAAFAVAAEILNRQTVKAYNSLLFSCCTENSLESLSVSVCIVQYCSFFLFRKWNLILTHFRVITATISTSKTHLSANICLQAFQIHHFSHGSTGCEEKQDIYISIYFLSLTSWCIRRHIQLLFAWNCKNNTFSSMHISFICKPSFYNQIP